MNVRYMRLGLGLLFLCFGVGTLVFRFGMPEAAAKFDPLRLYLGTALAFVLAGWNLSKWYAGVLWQRQCAMPVRTPLQPDPEGRGVEEYNPDFDFDKENKER